MNFLPISINIKNKKILLVGGGKVAVEKINSLKRFTSNITIITRDVDTIVREAGYPIHIKDYESSDLDGYFLVYACTNHFVTNQNIKKDCNRKGILVNVVDHPNSCDFVSPAIYKENNMTVAVSSDGKDVRKSIHWRNMIKEFIYGRT